jgi:hypothetical protein
MTLLASLFKGVCILVGVTLAMQFLSITVSLVSFCLGIPQLILSLFPGVSGLLEFLLKTAAYSVFHTHALFAWDHAMFAFVLTLLAVLFISKDQALTAYIITYFATFLYITISTLLPMFVLAIAVALVAKAICHFFPPARPKYTGPLMCFVVSLFVHSYFNESSEVSRNTHCVAFIARDRPLTPRQHAWVMPLSSTLSLLWTAGVFYCNPLTRRFVARRVNRRFLAQAEAPPILHPDPFIRRDVAEAQAPPAPKNRASGASSAMRSPANGQGLQGDRLITRDGGDVYTPNGTKVKGFGEDLTCAICYCNLKQSLDSSAAPVKVLQCSHVFHSHCIAEWYQREKSCPTCRDASSSLRNLRDFCFT